MPELSVFIDRVINLNQFAIEEGSKILVKEFKKEIEEYNRKQLEEGKNNESKTIQKGYSPGYSKTRKKNGLQTGFVDLKFTGKLYKSLDFIQLANPEEFGVISDVEYFQYVVGRFAKVMGLTEENAEKIAIKLSEKLAKKIEIYLKK